MEQKNRLASVIFEEIASITEKIRAIGDVEKIILFGSFAYGEPNADSDIDLCVITRDNRRKIEIMRDIQSRIHSLTRHPVDILVYRPEVFADRADSISTIEKTIDRKGLVLYG